LLRLCEREKETQRERQKERESTYSYAMLGDSAVLGTGGGSSGDGGAYHDGGETAVGGGGSISGDDERGGGSRNEEGVDRSFGGNRWPRQETLALLKIRSDMDVAFRDASVKGPLWDEVSRLVKKIYNFFNFYFLSFQIY
jgi:hypothetical protein